MRVKFDEHVELLTLTAESEREAADLVAFQRCLTQTGIGYPMCIVLKHTDAGLSGAPDNVSVILTPDMERY